MATDRSTPGAEAEEEDGSRARRWMALAAIAGAAALLFYLLFLSGEEYEVTAEFDNAAQLVEGGEVVVGGVPAGSVEEISLGPGGAAMVTFTVADSYAPLEEGTVATVRSPSLSQIAGRQVQLTLPPEGREGEEIPDGGLIPRESTVSAVDLDEIFNTLNDRTVRNLKKVIRGFEVSYDGVSKQANRGFRYLNPFLYTSRRLFSELTFDARAFERLIVDTSRLSGALAQRAPDISQLIGNLNRMMGAIGRQKVALAEAVQGLPAFMRDFNTTAVNLRAALDDLDPLVAASRPSARALQEFLPELRATADDLVPTVRDLDRIVKHRGPNNDLVELTRLQVPLAEIATGPVTRNGARRQGAFPESVQSLEDGLPNLEFFRGYTPELVGWFNDFGTSGIYDANGGMGRISTTFNTFIFSTPAGADTLPPNLTPFSLLPPPVQTASDQFFSGAGFDINNLRRCPGANERNPGDNSTPFTADGTLDCDPSQVPTGP